MTNITKAFLSQFILLYFLKLVPVIQAQSFQVLPLPAIHADAVSPDGNAVVGYTTVEAGNQGYIWTEDDGLTLLGTLPGHSNSRATGVASNGLAVVGAIFSPIRAYRWTPNGGMINLGATNELASFAFDVSADGSVVVGRDQNRNLSYQAFRWTAAGGMELLGGFIDGDHPSSEAHSVSADGNVVAGHSPMFNPGWELQAFRWTPQNGMVPIGEIIQDSRVIVSADGNTIIGTFNPGDGVQGFRWTASTGRVALGKLPGRLNSVARGVSADGSVVVGWSRGELNEDRDAFVWTEATGMRRLHDVLEDEYGLDLTGWSLREAYDISDDGSVIVGWGRDPENERRVFRVTLTEPSVIIVNSATDNPHDSSSTTECDTGELVEIDGEEVPECTLRAAIQTANARGGATIHFNIPGEPLISIEDVDDPLPPFESRIILDGTTQAGGFVELAGPLQIFFPTELGSNIDWAGLYIKQGGGGSEIRGMVIHNFPLANLKIGTGANNTIIENNRIGTDFSGTAAKGGGAPSCVIGGGILSTSTLGGCEAIELWGFPYEIGAGLHIMSSDNLIKDNVIAGNMLLRSDGDLYAGSVQVIIDYMAHRNRLQNNSIGIGNGGNLISIPSEPQVRDTNIRGIYILGSNNIIGGAPEAANRIGGHHIDIWIFNSAEELLRFDGGSGPSVPGPQGIIPTENVISHNTFGISSFFATFNDEQKEIYASDQSVWLFGQQNRFEYNEMATHRQALFVGGESNIATGNHIKAWDMQLSNSSMWDLLVGSIDGAVIVNGENHQVKHNTIESGEWGIQVTGTGKELDISENVIQSDEGGILISNVSRFEEFEDYRLNETIVSENEIVTTGYGILITDGVEATFKANRIKASGAGIVLPSVEDFERHNTLSSDGWQRTLLTQNQIDSPVGIDLKGDGVSLRHLFLGENGPNGMLNYPVISQAVRSGNTLQFEGWFDHSVFGNKEYTIEVFGNTGCAANMYTYGSYYGAGHEYLGSHYITPLASALGNSALSFSLLGLKDEHVYVTATVSIAEEFITSEFSMCLPISEPGQTAKTDTGPDETGLLLADMGVAVSFGDGMAKNNSEGAVHNGGTLFVTKYEGGPELLEFGNSSAQSNSGNQVTPKEIAPGYWMIHKFGFETPDGSDPVEFEVCLDPAGIVHKNDLNNSVIVKRNELSEGIWNPLDSKETVIDGITYLCAAGITEFSDFGIGADKFLGEDGSPEFAPFITKWKTDNDGVSGNHSIRIPLIGGGYDFTVDWGDGSGPQDYSPNVTDEDEEHFIEYTYDDFGEYIVSISGDFPRIYFNGTGDRQKILEVQQWGDIRWASMERAFFFAEHMDVTAEDAPDLSNVQSLAQMFHACLSFNGDIGHWNTDNITSMFQMFRRALAFNQVINTNTETGFWNTENVRDMRGMFQDAETFDQDISGWNTEKVSRMDNMFNNAKAFNQDLNGWNTGEVENIAGMFRDANAFDGDISGWNTAKVTTMNNTFRDATSFNRDLKNWVISSTTSLANMFQGASTFNQSLGSWNISHLTGMALDHLLDNTALSIQNYDDTLINWVELDVQSGVTFGAAGLQYCNGAEAHTILVEGKNWTITDAGLSDTCGEAPEGEDRRVLVSNSGPYTFSGADFGVVDASWSVRVESVPAEGDLSAEADDVLSIEDINAGDLTWTPPAGQHGYGFTSFGFTVIDDGTLESEDSYTMSIDLAAGSLELTGGQGWRFLTSPATGETVGGFLSPIWTQGFPGSNNPNASFTNVQYLDQEAYAWDATTVNSSDEFTRGLALIAYVFQDANGDGTPGDFPVTLVSGQQWTDLSQEFTFNSLLGFSEEAPNTESYFLLGNPHPVSVDFCGFTQTNVAASVAIWDPNFNGGDYRTLHCNNGGAAIAPFQGFWVRTTGSSPTLSIPEEAYLPSPGQGYFKQQGDEPGSPLLITLDVSHQIPQGFTNSVSILLHDDGTEGMDRYDAPWLSPQGLAARWLSFYALDENNKAYSIRSLPESFGEQVTIPLGIHTTEPGTYTLTWSLPEAHVFGGSYFLRDTKTGSVTELRNGQHYRFELESNLSSDHSKWSDDSLPGGLQSGPGVMNSSVHREWTDEAGPRFELLIARDGVNSFDQPGGLPTSIALAQNYPNPFNPSTIISYELPQTGHVRLVVYDMTGRHVATLVDTQMTAGRHQVSFNAMNLSSGVYMYRLQAGGQFLTRQLTLIK